MGWLVRTIGVCYLLCGLAIAQEPAAALQVSGDVASPLKLDLAALAKMPRQTVSVREESGATAQYEGVSLREVLQQAGAPLGKEFRGKALASYVLAKARDGYAVAFSLGELDSAFGNETILIADKRDGKPLTEPLGPFRLVCPTDKAGARSVRMLESLEVVRLRK